VPGLGDILVQHGVIDQQQLATAEAHQSKQGGSLAKSLFELGMATEGQLMQALATSLGMEYVDVSAGSVDRNVVAMLSQQTAEELTVLPVRFGGADDVIVAVAEPVNDEVLQRLASELGTAVTPALTSRRSLVEAIKALAPDMPAQPEPILAREELEQELVGVGASSAPAEADGGLPPPPAPGTRSSRRRGPALDETSQDVDELLGDSRLTMSEEEPEIDLDHLLIEVLNRGGSDLHLTTGLPPTIRINGDLTPLDDYPKLMPDELRKMLYAIMTQKHREKFENELELDMSYSVPGKARFRVNIFQQRDAMGSVMRLIPFEIMPLEKLGIPEQVRNFAYLPRGFVLVTGPTGSGKSTTLASLLDVVNETRPVHIMTVEDPIEFLHQHKRAVVNQREVGTDTHGFTEALKHVLRQDPDVILVGELRDLETIQIALTAAETGHLVFGTLHTQDAPQTIDRIIDVFPPHQQEQIRVMLAGALKGVVCQTLLKTADGKGRHVATEVMITTSGIKNLIREGKTHQVYSAIQAGAQYGMVQMDASLADLVKSGKVTYDAALEKANDVNEFNRLCGRA
jgi:twitching motility protein PilT